MKKVLTFAAIAAMMLSAVSCNLFGGGGNNNNNNGNDDENIVINATKYEDHAVKVTVPKDYEQPEDATEEYSGFEATEGGTFIIEATLKEDGETEFYTGKYSASKNGNTTTYNCEGFGTVEIVPVGGRSLASVIIKFFPKGKNGVTVNNATSSTNQGKTGTPVGNISRKWTVEKTVISVSGDNVPAGLGVARAFNGLNVPEIVEYINSYNLGIKDDAVAGYVVTEVEFSGNGTMMFTFTGKPKYKGTYNIVGNNTFTYDFSDTDSEIPVINGVATGSVKFLSAGSNVKPAVAELTVTSNIKSKDNKEYKGQVTLTLQEKKD